MQGTQVWSLVQEDPTCHRAAKPRATTAEPKCLEPVLHNRRSQHSEKPATGGNLSRETKTQRRQKQINNKKIFKRSLLILSPWYHLIRSPVPCISYELVIRSRNLIRFRFEFFANIPLRLEAHKCLAILLYDIKIDLWIQMLSTVWLDH